MKYVYDIFLCSAITLVMALATDTALAQQNPLKYSSVADKPANAHKMPYGKGWAEGLRS